MAVPATQGKQCKYLEEMEIGDYIRCTYTATEANVAGEFSDLGGFVDNYETEQQQADGEGNAVVDADGNPVMKRVMKRYEEIPIFTYASAATIPIQGYFYFLKVDKGLLVADRCVQNFISASSLNVKNYLQGERINKSLVRTLSQAEWAKYLTNGDLNGLVEKQDVNVWHINNYPTMYYNPLHNLAGTANYYHLIEYLSDELFGKIKVAMNINGTSYNDDNHLVATSYKTWEPNSIAYLTKYNDMRKILNLVQATCLENRFVNVHVNPLYRPALEYVDNPNSKTIFY